MDKIEHKWLFLITYFGGACLYTGKTWEQVGLILLCVWLPMAVGILVDTAPSRRLHRWLDRLHTLLVVGALVAPWVI